MIYHQVKLWGAAAAWLAAQNNQRHRNRRLNTGRTESLQPLLSTQAMVILHPAKRVAERARKIAARLHGLRRAQRLNDVIAEALARSTLR